MMVMDCSAALRVVLGTPEGLSLMGQVPDEEAIAAPSLFAAEAANALWKYERAGVLDQATAIRKLHEALDLVDELADMGALLDEALAEAVRAGHPVYDLLYLVLARRNVGTLLTFDRRLAALCDQMGVRHLPELGR